MFSQEGISLRKARMNDLPEMLELFVSTIEKACRKDYTDQQIKVWTSSAQNKELWEERLKNQYVILAITDNKIIGFASLENGNYLDMMYVHKDYMRKGIAIKLLKELEEEAKRQGANYISSDVSKTALPFFSKNGFSVVKENRNIKKGIEIINYKMIKDLNYKY